MASMATVGAPEPAKKRAAGEPTDRATKKPKKSVSVVGLFAKKPRTQQLEPGAGIDNGQKRHSTNSSEDIETARANLHPVYLQVKEATKAYIAESKASATEQLHDVEAELVARAEGMDINGKPLKGPCGPSKAELQALQEDQMLLRPLTEDVLTVAVTKSDGTVTHKDVKLGDSIEKMRKLFDDTEMKLNKLMEELNEVDEEIKETLVGYDTATKAVGDTLRKNLTQFEADAKAWHKQTLEDISKARKEDKAHGIEANRKLQEFAASLC